VIPDEGTLDQLFQQQSIFSEDRSDLAKSLKLKIAKARGSLLLDQPFFGYILGKFRITPTEDERIYSFAVDSNYLYFNTGFMEEIVNSDKWRGRIKGILLHLVLHLIYQHHLRQKERDAKIWSYAADIIVLQSIQEIVEQKKMYIDIEKPLAHQIPSDLFGLSTEKVYDRLLYDQEGSEEHQQLSEKRLDEYVDTSNFTKCDLDIIIENQKSQENKTDELSFQLFQGMIRSAYEMSKNHGDLPGNLENIINHLLIPKINWRTQLSQFIQKSITHDLSWSHPNKRLFSQGYYLPIEVKESINVILGVDTSGSIHQSELTAFLSEAQSILENISNVRLIVMDCDVQIQQIRIFESGESVLGHVFKGKGGTDLRPVIQKAKEYDPDLIIYFTDGYGPFSDPKDFSSIPILWVLTTDVTPPFGEIIRFNN
jgi:predicted metal-dependent peptidase